MMDIHSNMNPSMEINTPVQSITLSSPTTQRRRNSNNNNIHVTLPPAPSDDVGTNINSNFHRDHSSKKRNRSSTTSPPLSPASNASQQPRIGAPPPVRYEEYLNQEETERAVKNGIAFDGTLRVSMRNRREAYVTLIAAHHLPETVVIDDVEYRVEPDIFIDGDIHRNRAFDGDRVVVQLFDRIQWKKRVRKQQQQQQSTDVASCEQNNADAADVEDSCEKQQPCTSAVTIMVTGKVVAVRSILERKQCLYVGYLRSVKEGARIQPATDKFVMFVPTELRTTRMLIPVDGELRKMISPRPCHDDSGSDDDHLAREYFAAMFLRWSCTSILPIARLVERVGTSGEMNTEMRRVQIDNALQGKQFPPSILNELHERLQQQFSIIPASEYESRIDLRSSHRIFTIDPESSRDLDDALSVRVIRANDPTTGLCRLYEVGIHVADVSFFIPSGSTLDREARLRATSVYLADGSVIPMLPSVLSEELCSLNPDVDRLAFSVFVVVRGDDGSIATSEQGQGGARWKGPSCRFARTIIRSCARLSYRAAQNMIDGSETDDESVSNDVRTLHRLAIAMRLRKAQQGVLTLNRPKFKFEFDSATGYPIGIREYRIMDSNRLVEEMMLLANFVVARKLVLSQHTKEFALLRSHRSPSLRKTKEFMQFCKQSGLMDGDDNDSSCDVNASSPTQSHQSTSALLRSLNRVIDTANGISTDVGTLVTYQMRKMLNQAQYFCTGSTNVSSMQWHHFALNMDHYTHFTSPIRRYADLMVHRLLGWAMEQDNIAFGACTMDMDEELPELPQSINPRLLASTDSDLSDSDEEDATLPYKIMPPYLNADYLDAIAEHCNQRRSEAKRAEDQSTEATLLVMIQTMQQRGFTTEAITELDSLSLGSSSKSLLVYIPKFDIETRVRIDRELKDQCKLVRNNKDNKNLRVSWKYVPEGYSGTGDAPDDGTTAAAVDRREEFKNMAVTHQTIRILDSVRISVSVAVDPTNPFQEFKARLVKPESPLSPLSPSDETSSKMTEITRVDETTSVSTQVAEDVADPEDIVGCAAAIMFG